ncbi:SDR family NAD(P)-dependent oxidoreductase [Flavobacterium circumlabens]|uniref:Acetyltransferase (GNAT) family protein n=1 Tax=Flavobacterium circumlabens TaxID=2133765 RepID=A0A4Y7UDP9_9FLAO|nr:SDR family NAD(P)-dependent oxidoreductase [Flavobacterium circumlabens]TCN57665.1 acetyltransferase (GNAT) family protein [Flavobacterium circumlabens]TEB43969.1 SDR family NAD(P)-dependent oxidoreductase [Flavobacterium circumlabens]
MLNLLNTWSHGYIVIPVITAFQDHKSFEILSDKTIKNEDIGQILNGNEGYLKASYRILKSLGWIEQISHTEDKLIPNKIQVAPKGLVDLIATDNVSHNAEIKQVVIFNNFLLQLREGWGVNEPFFRSMLDGMLLAPVFFYLYHKKEKGSHKFDENWFHSTIKADLIDLFIERNWLVYEDNELTFSSFGSGFVERSMNFGTVISYNSLLLKLDSLIFHDANEVFSHSQEGHENHVDRTLNVISSGFQHKKYFDEVDNIIVNLFDNELFTEQPKYIADMGCGDGTFLNRIYNIIKDYTKRGKVLDIYPLTLIGIDFNEKALIETQKTLHNIPHITIHGDIGAPQNIPSDLKAYIDDPENILHVRSFLDHDRPFIAAQKKVYEIDSESFSIGDKGNLITQHESFGSLVEHFERWGSLQSKFGMLILEVHSLPSNIVNKFLSESENLHFDAYHAFSHQHLVEASTFILAAAGAGWFVDRDQFKKFPGQLPYSRITLSYFKKHNYIIRTPNIQDIKELYELEKKCWPQNLRKKQSVIKQRILNNPFNHLVVVIDNKIVGAVYTQFIADIDLLNKITFENIDELSVQKSQIVQLLNLNVDPEYQHMALGDHLLSFLLDHLKLKNHATHVVGISRCRDFSKQKALNFEQYVFSKNAKGEPSDPILKFHELHGATIVKVLEGYRKFDVENIGNGILIQYDLRTENQRQENQSVNGNKFYSQQDISADIEYKIKKLLRTEDQYHLTYPLMEMGLDSADLMELGVLITIDYNIEIAPSFFFQFNSPKAIIEELIKDLDVLKQNNTKVDTDTEKQPELEYSENDVAVIGYRFRFPKANTKEELWEILATGQSAIQTIPESRIQWPDWVDDHVQKGLKMGGFIDEIKTFDPAFFRITPKEAELMDPQQRILLQLTWELFESAGYKSSDFKGSQTGVYIGASGSDYELLLREDKGEDSLTGTGTSMALLANRLSYFFDLEGPSVQLDTACSSSLVAIHEAIKSIKSGECKQVVVGGINIICHSARSLAYQKANMLSENAKCSTFDKNANGFVRAEGAAVLLLKSLKDAIADKDEIKGIIKGSAINHGGLSGGLTVPNPDKQRKLVEKAFENAQIAVERISYIEAHGTGTSLGDPIEIAGLTQAFKNRKSKEDGGNSFAEKFCGIGSVKTNLGHLEAASGMAGMVKVLLSMEKRILPPTINFKDLNPKINLQNTPFYIADTLKSWEGEGNNTNVIAGISSFGIGGANAHVVVQSYHTVKKNPIRVPRQLVFILSATNENQLRNYALKLHSFLDEEIDLFNLAYTLQVAREEFCVRLAIVSASISQLKFELSEYLSGKTSNVTHYRKVVDVIGVDSEVRNSDPNEIAINWTKGHNINWSIIDSDVERTKIEIPTYPFSKEEYWIPQSETTSQNENWKPVLCLKQPNQQGRLFSCTLSGNESFLTDHIINGEKILPGVVSVEMAKHAVKAVTGRSITALKNVNWFKPHIVNGPQEIFIKIFTKNNELNFEIFTEGEAEVNCNGSFDTQEVYADKSINIHELQYQLSAQGQKEYCYKILGDNNFKYGPTYAIIESINYGIDEALSFISFKDDFKGKELSNLGIMDAALQTCLLQGLLSGTETSVTVPYSAGKLMFYDVIPDQVWCYVQKNSSANILSYNLQLFDQNGHCLAVFNDFVFLKSKVKSEQSNLQKPFFTETWKRILAMDTPNTPYVKGVLISGGENLKIAKEFEQFLKREGCNISHYEKENLTIFDEIYFFQGIQTENTIPELNVFQQIKNLMADVGEKDIALTVFTQNTQQIFAGQKVNDHGSGIIGIMGSLSKEVPHWKIRIIDLDTGHTDFSQLYKVPFNGQITAVRENNFYQRFLMPLSLVQQQSSIFETQKVYVILGGAGGIGKTTTKYLVKKYHAQIVWLGRSAENQNIVEDLDYIATLGPRPLYIQCDARDLDQVKNAYQIIKRNFTAVHGIFHSAIVLNDKLIKNMSESDFVSNFSTKQATSQNLIKIFNEEPLDFICFYSSIQSYWTAIGQANYAGGCTFIDSFAKSLENKAECPVYTINWGYWGGVGIVSDESYRLAIRANGVDSITEEEGMQFLETILSNNIKKVTAIKLLTQASPVMESCLFNKSGTIADQKSQISYMAAEKEQFRLKKEIRTDLDKICSKGILQILSGMGIENIQRSDVFPKLWGFRNNSQFRYEKLLTEIISKAIEFGHAVEVQNRLMLDYNLRKELIQWNLLRELDHYAIQYPSFKAHINLLKQCFSQYAAIFQNQIRATEVIFPNGRFDLVNDIYKNNYQSDYFNELLGETIYNIISKTGKRLDQINILEIGAGTGGSSDAVLKKLNTLDNDLKYCFTDISNSFLIEAQSKYANKISYLEIRKLDIEQDIRTQGFDYGTFDIVLGTNVLHATKNITKTLSNVKSLLKQNGLVILNELTESNLFYSLTFGLLDGWWLHEDNTYRLQGSPLLSKESWRQALLETGFENVVFSASSEAGQELIAAKSNGVIFSEEKKNGNISHEIEKETLSNTSQYGNAEAFLKSIFSKVLKMKIDAINELLSFDQLGIDSILIGNLSKELALHLDNITTTLFFEYRNLRDLANYLSNANPSFFDLKATADTTKTEVTDTIKELEPHKERVATNDIAIIGIAGKYPGAKNLNQFWDNLKQGKNSISEIPKERWDNEVFFTEEKGKEGTINGKFGGFIEGVDEFDPLFFTISPKEAERMDPQERLFLQTVFETIGEAGYTPEQLSGDGDKALQTGVYVGVMYQEYQFLGIEETAKGTPVALGKTASSIANRISYQYSFTGPSMAIDTMCSSSLTAIHLACNDLLSGNCDVAIAGGVNISIHPNKYLMLSQGAFLSSKGRCESFAQDGDGFVPSEGVGAVLLKTLHQAIKDGDHIHGVIKSTTVNHGGKVNGFTVPNPDAQAQVIKNAIHKAGINPEDISYVETHGTGTSLGDPIEIRGLVKAYNTDKKQFCSIGSVKSNIGHCESAAGIAGITKLILQFKHAMLVPSIHSQNLNSNIDFKNTPFKVQQNLEQWKRGSSKPLIAGISGFGAGGSNAHLILEEYIANEQPITKGKSELILLSAKNKDRLLALVSDLSEHLEIYPDSNLQEIAYTLQNGRLHMESRLAFSVQSVRELRERLQQFSEGNLTYLAVGDVKKRSFNSFENTKINHTITASQNEDYKILAELWVLGEPINLNSSGMIKQPFKASLPVYSFEKKKCWIAISKKETQTPLSNSNAGSTFDLENQVRIKILGWVSEILKIDLIDLDTEEELGEYGFDSVTLVQFSTAINQFYELDLAPTVFYNYPTVERLIAFLISQFGPDLIKNKLQAEEEGSAKNRLEEKKTDHINQTNFIDQRTNGNIPIAVVGMSARFPGSPTIEEFWENLIENKDLISKIPTSRWKTTEEDIQWGGFIEGIDEFDSLFFNISPAEAELMDPQQRITLETVFRALEDAGIPSNKIKGSNTGVFIGSSSSDYATLINKNGNGEEYQAHFATGIASSVLANRISYLFDFHGPSEPVDTACSSSLIALHKAVQNIRNGECKLAIAGGVNALLSPELSRSFNKAGMLSKDGRCKTFDESANGYVRGEGVGIVVLKSLTEAIENGDQIYAVIEGSAENHGGKSNTMTSPNPNAQKELLIKAFNSAKKLPNRISYIEAHGTGTPLGDPIETEGLKLAFEVLSEHQSNSSEQEYCALGSVKTNIGHLEAAAGIAGFIKLVLALKNKTIPGNPHLENPNKYLQLKGTPFYLQKETGYWPTSGNLPRVAGISSFGAGGSNAHILVSEYDNDKKKRYDGSQQAVIVLSAQNRERLKQRAADLYSYIVKHSFENLHDIAYTLQNGRNEMEDRLAIIASNIEELANKLVSFINDENRNSEGENIFTTSEMQGQKKALLTPEDIEEMIKVGQLGFVALHWVNKQPINWLLLYRETKPHKISLPTYPFTKERYWFPVKHESQNQEMKLHPLLHFEIEE